MEKRCIVSSCILTLATSDNVHVHVYTCDHMMSCSCTQGAYTDVFTPYPWLCCGQHVVDITFARGLSFPSLCICCARENVWCIISIIIWDYLRKLVLVFLLNVNSHESNQSTICTHMYMYKCPLCQLHVHVRCMYETTECSFFTPLSQYHLRQYIVYPTLRHLPYMMYVWVHEFHSCCNNACLMETFVTFQKTFSVGKNIVHVHVRVSFH